MSRAGYYDSIDRPTSPRAERTAKIHASVRQVFAESHTIYGPAKIAEALQRRDDLETACRNTVARAMREMGLKSRVRKAFTPTTTQADPTKRPAPNTLDRDFTAERPNQKWVTDITYLPTLAGWVYLAVVVDLGAARWWAGRFRRAYRSQQTGVHFENTPPLCYLNQNKGHKQSHQDQRMKGANARHQRVASAIREVLAQHHRCGSNCTSESSESTFLLRTQGSALIELRIECSGELVHHRTMKRMRWPDTKDASRTRLSHPQPG